MGGQSTTCTCLYMSDRRRPWPFLIQNAPTMAMLNKGGGSGTGPYSIIYIILKCEVSVYGLLLLSPHESPRCARIKRCLDSILAIENKTKSSSASKLSSPRCQCVAILIIIIILDSLLRVQGTNNCLSGCGLAAVRGLYAHH